MTHAGKWIRAEWYKERVDLTNIRITMEVKSRIMVRTLVASTTMRLFIRY